ncbi:MAG: 50S ribosomal protein L2 [Candidatus Aenigmatarchaeota archaeon]
MGKRPIIRARGKGGPRYLAPSHRFFCKYTYPLIFEKMYGKVIDIVHTIERTAPIAIVKLDSGQIFYQIAPDGIKTGDTISINGEPSIGSVLMLKDIPDGSKIYGIEKFPGSGPKICRAAGSCAILIGKSEKVAKIQLPSGKVIELDVRCRASIGMPAGYGRQEKPFLKAGKKYYAMKARNKKWPIVSASKMNPVDHPWGGKSKRPKISKQTSARMPLKVGSVGPKYWKKRKKK